MLYIQPSTPTFLEVVKTQKQAGDTRYRLLAYTLSDLSQMLRIFTDLATIHSNISAKIINNTKIWLKIAED